MLSTFRSLLASTLVLLSANAGAEIPESDTRRHAGHDQHAALPHDSGLSLSAAVESAWRLSTDLSTAAAAEQEAAVLSARGRQLLAGSPSLFLRYQSDRWQTRLGQRELEAGIEMPLWRLGQRAALAREGKQAKAFAEENQQLRRWRVAGLVRELYWQERQTAFVVDRAQSDLAAWQKLEQDVLRRIRAGDAAPVERLVAENARRERELAVHDAEVAHIDSEFRWRTLTGLDRLPDSREELLSNRDAGLDWPPLRQARLHLTRQQEAFAAARAQGAGSPRLLISTRRDDSPTDRVDSLGATLTLPFGGSSHQQAALLLPANQLAEAEDAVRSQEREASLARHEASHELAAKREAQEQLAARLALSAQEVELSRRAYTLGEITLTERLLAEQRHADIQRQHGLALIAVNLAIARYNQAQGILP